EIEPVHQPGHDQSMLRRGGRHDRQDPFPAEVITVVLIGLGHGRPIVTGDLSRHLRADRRRAHNRLHPRAHSIPTSGPSWSPLPGRSAYGAGRAAAVASARAPSRVPARSASPGPAPPHHAASSPAAKASPAPVTSTTTAGSAGTSTAGSSRVVQTAPDGPRLM